jgi:hypothetical protein
MLDIPNVPGVPSLPSYSANNVALLVADGIAAFALSQFTSGWGIFYHDIPIQAFPYNSIVDFDYKQDFPVSDYQQEDGGFQSYDKVQLPFDVKVRVASGGTEIERQALLISVIAAANTLNLFDVQTPEFIYQNCCITHFDYKRQSHNGVGMIVIDIWFIEIRITSTATLSTTQTPAVAGNQSVGNVAPTSFPTGGTTPIQFT